ncbi:MAG TPA: outer membrane beta-barrel protein [Bacteroidales bacterium]|nr:outer membrane beta-barrel protein [Bacteroidales bacterium]
MNKTIFFTLVFFFISYTVKGQTYSLRGEVLNEKAEPLSSVAAVLLNANDSTLLYFSVTGAAGIYELNNIKKGSYLLQISLLGYRTFYKHIDIPLQPGEFHGPVILEPVVFSIDEVTISGERIPLRIRQDTIEYDARAYKVKPDAVAEDIIRKLPGIEVDRAGNIKALGEDVENVLVDGKEFFGSDPKVATKNLPADAIERVQLYDRPTDESQFTGIDDGERNPTLNLVLDDESKQGLFGDVSAGGGSDKSYQANAKLYRFTGKTQLAALGMTNNVNQYGFSVNDYINFSGGLNEFSSGGHILPESGGSFPVNFGQPVTGRGSGGAAGLNFSVSNADNDRFFISYLGNGSKRKTIETSLTKNYIPGGEFTENSNRELIKTDTAHRFNFGLRKKSGEKQNLILNGGLSFNSSDYPLTALSQRFTGNSLMNELERISDEGISGLSGNGDLSYLLKIKEGKTILGVSAKVEYSGNDSRLDFVNRTSFFNPAQEETVSQFLDIDESAANYSGSLSLTQKIAKSSFLDFVLSASYGDENMVRRQGNNIGEMSVNPALSPDFYKISRVLNPGIKLKFLSSESSLTLSLLSALGEYKSVLNNDPGVTQRYGYLNPGLSWEYSYRSGRRIMADYTSGVSTPSVIQLLPVVNNLNPLTLFYGNRQLKPEYFHNARISWWLFDQFSFTTLLSSLNLRYTINNTGYSRTVNEDLRQTMTLTNTGADFAAGMLIDFSTAVRPLAVKINLVLDNSYNRSISLINGRMNVNNTNTNRISFTVGNRNKEKWDLEAGTEITFTSTRYSVNNELNNRYHDYSFFSEARFSPGRKLSFLVSSDITRYSAGSFGQSLFIPLLNTETSLYLSKNQRAAFTLAAIDLFNRNTGVERLSEFNTLTDRRSNILGRYFMISFRYRLNKTGDSGNGVDIQVKSR